MATSKFKKLTATLLLSTALLGAGVSGGTSAYALTSASEESLAQERLVQDVYGDVSDNLYHDKEGDGVKGSDLLTEKGNVTDTYENLQESDKKKFLVDVNQAVNDSYQEDTQAANQGEAPTNQVTKNTVSQFWSKLQDQGTVSNYMIAVATRDVRPDFNGASDFLRPVTPTFNMFMGVFLILASLSFFLFIAVDVFYFMATPFQYVVKSGEGNKAFKVLGGFVSKRAQDSLAASEQGNKNPLIIYLGKTWVMGLAYALVLLYFASNSMLTLYGPLANLVSGILGF